MTEKKVLEDYAREGVTTLRQRHDYPKWFRMGAGAVHTFNAITNAIGGLLFIVGKDAIVGTVLPSDLSIQARSSAGFALAVMGGVTLGVALFNAYLALGFFSGRQQIYWLAILVNSLAVAAAVMAPPSNVLTWLQTGAAFLIAALLLLDPRVKAFYDRGPFRETWWNEETQRQRAGKS